MDENASKILLTCLSYASGTSKKDRLAGFHAEEWQGVIQLAQQHAVAPLLYYHLLRMGVDVPFNATEQLRQARLKNMTRNLRLYRDLGKLLKVLQENNIPVLVLKGAYLAEFIYPNRSLRFMADIDLLVNIDDLPGVDLSMNGMGYRKDYENWFTARVEKHFLYRHPNRDFHFEIHWVLFRPEHPSRIDLQGLWSRAQLVTIAQAPVMTMIPEDLLVYLCMHTANKFTSMRLSMFCDIGEVIQKPGQDLDWQMIAERTREWGTPGSVYFILRLAEELLGVNVPQGWLASIRPADFEERYIEPARRHLLYKTKYDEDTFSSPNVARFGGENSLKDKIILIGGRLFPRRGEMEEMYPNQAGSWRIYLYYPVRWKDVLARHGKLVWQVVRGDPKTKSDAVRANEFITLQEWVKSSQKYFFSW